MTILSSRLIRHEICKDELKAMGAKVIDIHGNMVLVKFDLEGHSIAYAYYINEDNTYLLERIKPYFISIGNYEYEEDVIEGLKIDIEQFKNAMNSKNFEQFIEIDNHLSKLVRLFEDLYLYYNIEASDLKTLDQSVDCILDNIKEIMSHSKRVYTKKDPDVLKDNYKF